MVWIGLDGITILRLVAINNGSTTELIHELWMRYNNGMFYIVEKSLIIRNGFRIGQETRRRSADERRSVRWRTKNFYWQLSSLCDTWF